MSITVNILDFMTTKLNVIQGNQKLTKKEVTTR